MFDIKQQRKSRSISGLNFKNCPMISSISINAINQKQILYNGNKSKKYQIPSVNFPLSIKTNHNNQQIRNKSIDKTLNQIKVKNIETNRKQQQSFSKGKENSILFSFKPVDSTILYQSLTNSHARNNNDKKSNHNYNIVSSNNTHVFNHNSSVYVNSKGFSKHKNSVNQWDQIRHKDSSNQWDEGRYSSVKKLQFSRKDSTSTILFKQSKQLFTDKTSKIISRKQTSQQTNPGKSCISLTNQQNIKVSIRFRPLHPTQQPISQQRIRLLNKQVILIDADKLYSFDRLFGQENQQQVYQQLAMPIVDKCFQGYNGTIFAYGQTGSGKTHTIFGTNQDHQLKNTNHMRGIIPRALQHIFTKKQQNNNMTTTNNNNNKIYTNKLNSVSCSLVQIYNQTLIDLFNFNIANVPQQFGLKKAPIASLKLKQSKQKGVYIQNLSEIRVESQVQLLQKLSMSLKNRRTSSTKLNQKSSRSHTILTFILTFQQYTTKLSLIDLAGSQKINKSGVKGQALEETKNINYSLSCLGNVINALTTRVNNQHIPFRDSKLTRILKDSLTGNFLTSIIVTCSLAHDFYNETISSLKFAQRVKRIKISPQNQQFIKQSNASINQPNDCVQYYQTKILELAKQLEDTKNQLNQFKLKQSSLCTQQNSTLVTQMRENIENQQVSQDQASEHRTTTRRLDQTDRELTSRLAIPSQRANVSQKLRQYLQKQIVQVLPGSRKHSHDLHHHHINLSIRYPLLQSSYKSSIQQNEQIYDDISDTTKDYMNSSVKKPNRKIVQCEDQDQEISFNFSRYREDDFTSDRALLRSAFTKRTIR